MAVHYVGGKPTRVTCYTKRKNADRWMQIPKHQRMPMNGELIFLNIMGVVVCMLLVWFVAMCIK